VAFRNSEKTKPANAGFVAWCESEKARDAIRKNAIPAKAGIQFLP
jgi:hypothetical protein